MDVMKKVARKHGLVCLLHEKPFAGINGSGKHDNWSLATDSGDNLFKPGSTPSQNARFLLFLAAFVKGVDEYQDFLRATVAFAGNDHRLGAQEAPPAVVSIFLGDELTAVVESIIHGTEYSDPGKKSLRVGVDVMPPIPQDNTDRNRTSPMAFTGNKFEFRMLGSSQSIAGPNIALNTIMAEELEQFADELEGADDFNEALASLIRRVFTQHQRIIFNGNGYEDAWLQEAARRGLYRRRPARLHRREERGPVYQARHLHQGGDGGPPGDPHGELLPCAVHRGQHHGGYDQAGYPARRLRLRRGAGPPGPGPGRQFRLPVRDHHREPDLRADRRAAGRL